MRILSPYTNVLESNKKAYLTPLLKKRRVSNGEDEGTNLLITIRLKLVGMGPEIENRALRADLNINIVL
jgi:hypothetical protein